MSDDIIERAEAALKFDSVKVHGQLVRELIAELKAARAEIELRDELREDYCPFCAHCEEG
jgi:uncharacterized membrane protein